MLDVAIDAAKAGGELALKYFKSHPKVSYKADKTPVTRADIEAEKLIRKIITKKFPDHGIIGEELGTTNQKSRFQWTIDPIDGTRYFAHGLPFWGTLLALIENGKPIIGISYLPLMGHLFLAQKGKGAFLNGKRTRVSKTSNLEFSSVANGSLVYFNAIKKLKNLLDIYGESRGSKVGIGGIYGYSLLAQGLIEICLDPKSEIYDIAAPSIIIEEAGGKFSDFSGKFSLTAGAFVATNEILHSKVLKLLNSR